MARSACPGVRTAGPAIPCRTTTCRARRSSNGQPSWPARVSRRALATSQLGDDHLAGYCHVKLWLNKSPHRGPIIARQQRVFPTLLPSLPSNVPSLTVPAAGLVQHTDRGGQYTVAAYRAALAARRDRCDEPGGGMMSR